jgi:uncharacterized repeat protein (TIGR01451 family)
MNNKFYYTLFQVKVTFVFLIGLIPQLANSQCPLTLNAAVTDAMTCWYPVGQYYANPNGTGTFTYAWSTGETTNGINISTQGTYSCTVTRSPGGCTAVTSNYFPEKRFPIFLSATKSGNISCATPTVSLSASASTGSGGALSYSWSNGGSGAGTAVSAAGTYTIYVYDGSNGCSSTASVAVTGAAASPTFTAASVLATCTAGVANSNARIQLSTFDGNSNKVGYSAGTSYTGPAFASATTISGGAPFTVVNTLPNPSSVTPYTARVFCDAATFTDVTVLLERKLCNVADLSITVTSTPQTGNQGEIITYTYTATNNGPDIATGVLVDTPMPSNITLLNATPNQGTYNTATKIWDLGTLANGVSKTLIVSLKIN